MGPIQQLSDPLGNKRRLLFVSTFPDFYAVKLHRRLRQQVVGNSLPKHFRFTVGKSAHSLTHTVGKHIVDRLDHLRTRAEIGAEKDLPPFTGLCFLHGAIIPVFFQKDSGICQPELINGLLHIAHQKAIVPFGGQCLKNCVLDTVGVLVFIHHDFPEPAADLICRRSSAAAFGSQQQVQHLVLQIAEIQHPAAALCPGIGLVKPAYQTHQAPGRSPGLGQVLQNLRRGVRKTAQVLFKALLAGAAAGFDLLGQGRIHIFPGEGQPAKVDILPLHHLVPVFRTTQMLQLIHRIPQNRSGLFHTLCRLCQLRTPAHHVQLLIQIVNRSSIR